MGIERLDYTKGIPQRLEAVDHLEESSGTAGPICLCSDRSPITVSRPEYQRVQDSENELLEVNARWQERGWQPILFLKEHHGAVGMMALHRLASFCMVDSLHDGMNLVAKEFIASGRMETVC